MVLGSVVACMAAAQKSPSPAETTVPLSKLVLVENGQPKAEIVVAPARPRMTTLAALELQHYLHKMSGARLPIVTEASDTGVLKIYVGRSPGTDKLGITPDGLNYGAFRIASGTDWLVLLGKDLDFTPPQEMPLTRGDIERAEAAWAEKTKGKTVGWGNPFTGDHRKYWNPGTFAEILTNRYGPEAIALWKGDNEELTGFWEYDESGSLNAVSDLLRRLGVRWFMPGELGAAVPASSTISIAPINETVQPGFAVRDWLYYGYAGFSFDEVLYGRHLGMNSGIEKVGTLTGPHGLTKVTTHEAMKAANPEYYALIGGKRDTEHRGHGTPNFVSDALVEETANYVRFLYDTYDAPLVDLWPVDGLVPPQDEASRGKTASELVWGFIDRVAREVYKTHPDRLVGGGAYTSYLEPPDSIEKFSPNVLVQLSNRARPRMMDDEYWAAYQALVEKWKSKLAPGNLMRYENNRYFIRTDDSLIDYPVIHPRAIARELKFMQGISVGETGEQSQRKARWSSPALNHLNLYVQARMLWNPDQDLDALLDEYFTIFYGPAAQQMKAVIAYAEENLAVKDRSRGGSKGDFTKVPLETQLRFRELLEAAREAAGDGIHGERVSLLLSELTPAAELEKKHHERETAWAAARAAAPVALAVQGSDLDKATTYTLKNNRTGEEVSVQTSFRVGWDKDALIFDVVCKAPDMAKVVSSADVYTGDYVAISIETPRHSFYHIEISPEGKIVEGNPGTGWNSLAEVKSENGPDFWRLRVRIPVVGVEEAEADPNHRVAGEMPTAEAPWFFNVGRQRVLEGRDLELQSFSPTGGNWRVPIKFGRLQVAEEKKP